MSDLPENDDSRERSLELVFSQVFEQILRRDERFMHQQAERDASVQEKLMQMVTQMVHANTMDRVLVNGFEAVAKQLEVQMAPLRTLGREYVSLSREQDALLATLQRALTRIDFSQEGAADAIRTIGNTAPSAARTAA